MPHVVFKSRHKEEAHTSLCTDLFTMGWGTKNWRLPGASIAGELLGVLLGGAYLALVLLGGSLETFRAAPPWRWYCWGAAWRFSGRRLWCEGHGIQGVGYGGLAPADAGTVGGCLETFRATPLVLLLAAAVLHLKGDIAVGPGHGLDGEQDFCECCGSPNHGLLTGVAARSS